MLVDNISSGAKLKTRSWATSTVFIDTVHSYKSKKKLYFSISPISDDEIGLKSRDAINGKNTFDSIYQNFLNSITQKDYELVSTSEEADISLVMTVKLFNKTNRNILEKINNLNDYRNFSEDIFHDSIPYLTSDKTQTRLNYNMSNDNDTEKNLSIPARKNNIGCLITGKGAGCTGGEEDTDYSGLVIGGLIGYQIASGGTGAIIAGALIGEGLMRQTNNLFAPDAYIALADLQINEKTSPHTSPIVRNDKRILKQDDFSIRQIEFSDKTNYKEYRTRLVASAQRSFLSRKKAEEKIKALLLAELLKVI